MSTPALTVVIPTKDRPGPLAACLAALAAQDLESIQIVVVDDGSRDDRAVARVVVATPGARLLRVRGHGPAAARNLGAQIAAAPVVCFTDDDCRPDPGWARALLRALESGAVVAAGPTRNANAQDLCAAAAQTVTTHLTEWSLNAERTAAGFVPTCNLAVVAGTARAFPFDEDFPLAAGEDREWCGRLGDAGVPIRWVPDALVHHHQDLPWRAFWRQQVRYGRGARQHHATRPRGQRMHERAFYTGLTRRGFDQGVRVGVLVVISQVATAVGFSSGAKPRRS